MQPTSRPITSGEFDALIKVLTRVLASGNLPVWFRRNTVERLKQYLVSPRIFAQERNDGTYGVSLTLDQFGFKGAFQIRTASKDQKLTVEVVAYTLTTKFWF